MLEGGGFLLEGVPRKFTLGVNKTSLCPLSLGYSLTQEKFLGGGCVL